MVKDIAVTPNTDNYPTCSEKNSNHSAPFLDYVMEERYLIFQIYPITFYFYFEL